MEKKSLLSLLFIGFSLLTCSCSKKAPGSLNSSDSISINESQNDSNVSSPSDFQLNEKIQRIQVATDDVGIYSVVIYLSDKIAEKGSLEFIYKGEKGSPQEKDTIATFTSTYWIESTGYEIQTLYNGDVYENQHKKEEIKLVLTFGAGIRAGDVTIFYTPDGGSKEQIFYSSEACSYHN